MSEHTAQTDTKNKVKLESKIIYAEWVSPVAVGGHTANFKVVTSMVGEGATIEIKGKSSKGKTPESLKGTVYGNVFTGSLFIPEKVDPSAEVWFEAKLPKHGLKMESQSIPARPPIYATLLKWDRSEVKRGEIVKMKGNFEGCPPDSEACVIIYEYNPDGFHDKVALIPTQLNKLELEIGWQFDYFDETVNIPTQKEKEKYKKNYVPVQYFFVVEIDGVRIGEGRESGLMKFKDSLEIQAMDRRGNPLINCDCTITFADGTKLTGRTDSQGTAIIKDVPPGDYEITYTPQNETV